MNKLVHLQTAQLLFVRFAKLTFAINRMQITNTCEFTFTIHCCAVWVGFGYSKVA